MVRTEDEKDSKVVIVSTWGRIRKRAGELGVGWLVPA